MVLWASLWSGTHQRKILILSVNRPDAYPQQKENDQFLNRRALRRTSRQVARLQLARALATGVSAWIGIKLLITASMQMQAWYRCCRMPCCAGQNVKLYAPTPEKAN
jgi:hypothetical protein